MMQQTRPRSVRRKLMLLLSVVSCVVLLLASTGFAISDWVSSRSAVFDRLRAEAAIIGNNSVAALTFRDQQAARDTLATLKSEQDVVGAVLFDAAGLAFADYRRAARRLPSVALPLGQGEWDGALYISLPVRLEQETVGRVLLLSELGNWRNQQLQRLLVLLGLFVLVLGVALVLSNLAQRVVTRPILDLARTVRRITETRNYELRAQPLSRDEIGSLADDFNEMLNQIQHRDNELQLAQAQLENKVRERTEELLALTRQLEHQAYHDALTGLPNRTTFDRNLQAAINLAQRHGHQLMVMFLDLDRFKGINDTLGHAVGDKLLVLLAQRLESCLRRSDTLARLGGDEFAVLLQETSPDAAAEVAGKLIQAVNQPVQVGNYTLRVTTSIGISAYPEDGSSVGSLLKNADTAMYFAKEAGKNQFSFFAQQMNARTERRMRLENKLRTALGEQLLQVYYQPKYDAQSGRLMGVEALVRWFDAEEGFISPQEFIPLAEDCGLVGAIDDWVTRVACLDLCALYPGREPELTLAVNFSPADFVHKSVCSRIADTLRRTGFPGHRLELEVTEAVVASEVDYLNEHLDNIRALGVTIAIDDFGIAYSSLSRLKQLPLNTLKIDRSFIRDIGNDQDDEVIVRTIIDMAHNLNLKVVAEGVETQAQYAFVRRHGCDQVQGYLFAKPMPLQELRQLVAVTVATPAET